MWDVWVCWCCCGCLCGVVVCMCVKFWDRRFARDVEILKIYLAVWMCVWWGILRVFLVCVGGFFILVCLCCWVWICCMLWVVTRFFGRRRFRSDTRGGTARIARCMEIWWCMGFVGVCWVMYFEVLCMWVLIMWIVCVFVCWCWNLLVRVRWRRRSGSTTRCISVWILLGVWCFWWWVCVLLMFCVCCLLCVLLCMFVVCLMLLSIGKCRVEAVVCFRRRWWIRFWLLWCCVVVCWSSCNIDGGGCVCVLWKFCIGFDIVSFDLEVRFAGRCARSRRWRRVGVCAVC